MSPRLLVVEDEDHLRRPLVNVLKLKGYTVDALERGDGVVPQVLEQGYDLILLDVMLPGMSGFEVLQTLRQQGVRTPIIMLTALGEELDRVLGFELGVDDYVTKPFSVLELLGRIGAVLRRQGEATPAPVMAVPVCPPPSRSTVRVGAADFDLKAFTAQRDGTAVALPAKAFRVLEVLLEHAGQVVSRDQLMDAAWGDEAVNERTLSNLVVKLRQAVESDPSTPACIASVHGVGYRLERSAVEGD